jgi:hypothetical protein
LTSASPIVVNGSLTGPIANGGVPTGWSINSGSPDTMDQTHNVGVTSVSFASAPSGPSPDGGTWVGFARDGASSFTESFGQTISGFDIGTQYRVSWYQGNFGAVISGPQYQLSNAIEALINTSSIGNGGVLLSSSNWTTGSATFTATATTLRLDFRLLNAGPSYLSIDGVTIREVQVNTVPEPATLAVFGGLALAGALGYRRRKATA